MAYHNGQPFNDNMLRPCPLLDNPQALRKMVDESGAKSTDVAAPEDVHELTSKTEEAAKTGRKLLIRFGRVTAEPFLQKHVGSCSKGR